MVFIAATSLLVAYFASYRYQKREQKKQKAYLLAQYYMKYLIPRQRFIKNVLFQIELLDHIENFYKEATNYNKEELESLLGHDKIKFINEKLENEVKYPLLKKAVFGYCEKDNLFIEKLLNFPEDPEFKYFSTFQRFIYDTLNELEIVSMAFVNELADEKFVYQPLHSKFLINIRYLCFFIALNNPADENEYQKIQELHKIWRKRRDEHRDAVRKLKNEILNHPSNDPSTPP